MSLSSFPAELDIFSITPSRSAPFLPAHNVLSFLLLMLCLYIVQHSRVKAVNNAIKPVTVRPSVVANVLMKVLFVVTLRYHDLRSL